MVIRLRVTVTEGGIIAGKVSKFDKLNQLTLCGYNSPVTYQLDTSYTI